MQKKKLRTLVRWRMWSGAAIPRAFEVNETRRIGQSAAKQSRNLLHQQKTARKNSHQNATTLFPFPAERALELSVNNISVDGPRWGGDEENEKYQPKKKPAKESQEQNILPAEILVFLLLRSVFSLPHNPLFAASTSSPLSAVLWRRNISRSEKKVYVWRREWRQKLITRENRSHEHFPPTAVAAHFTSRPAAARYPPFGGLTHFQHRALDTSYPLRKFNTFLKSFFLSSLFLTHKYIQAFTENAERWQNSASWAEPMSTSDTVAARPSNLHDLM